MLDKFADFLFGRTGDLITKWGIALCGVIIFAELATKLF